MAGWKVEGGRPPVDRYVIIAAPHTSNWDLPFMLAFAFIYDIPVRWMGKHTLFEESLRSPLIVSYRGVKKPGESTDSMVETLDVFPTICDLAGLPLPDFVDGVSLRPMLEEPASPGHPALSYGGRAKTIRTDTHRLILHNDGHVELYDHTSAEKETKNIAEANPALVEDLRARLEKRLNRE